LGKPHRTLLLDIVDLLQLDIPWVCPNNIGDLGSLWKFHNLFSGSRLKYDILAYWAYKSIIFDQATGQPAKRGYNINTPGNFL
jgi:hypothetical protein